MMRRAILVLLIACGGEPDPVPFTVDELIGEYAVSFGCDDEGTTVGDSCGPADYVALHRATGCPDLQIANSLRPGVACLDAFESEGRLDLKSKFGGDTWVVPGSLFYRGEGRISGDVTIADKDGRRTATRMTMTRH